MSRDAKPSPDVNVNEVLDPKGLRFKEVPRA